MLNCLTKNSYGLDKWDVEILKTRFYNVDNEVYEVPAGMIAYPQQGSYPHHKGRSKLYGSSNFKVPSFQVYNPEKHQHIETYPTFLLHLPPQYFPHLPLEILQEIAEDKVEQNSISLFIVGQEFPFKIKKWVEGFYPSYATDPLAPQQSFQPYEVEQNIKCMLYNEDAQNVEFYRLPNDKHDASTIMVNNNKTVNDAILTSKASNKTFIVHNNCCHPQLCNHPSHTNVLISPAPLGVKGINKDTTKSLYSYVTWTENTVKKAIITLHMFYKNTEEVFTPLLQGQNSGVKTTQELINIFRKGSEISEGHQGGKNPFAETVRLLNFEAKPLRLITSSVEHHYSYLSLLDDFNPELYLFLHPGLRIEAEKEQMDPIAYAKKQFISWGWKHNHYLPLDFNPDLYLDLHPGLKIEAEKEQMTPVAYAKKQFVSWGWKHNHYLPLDFNPNLYLHLHPGLRMEAEKAQMDPVIYAGKQFASWGWKHNHYLPLDFNPNLYLYLHPGLRGEAEKEQMDPVIYAGKQFASWGWKHNHYLPLDFNPESYLHLNPGVMEEANQKGMEPVKYARWHYALHGFQKGFKYQ